eukprot:CAMPEP_0113450270 /NCGR_PEP_ID=MMETSP0014_2-20120614/5740_1 /TAXON_ID=2857 /ORGANISM="Nitzschia sp." /LENGTH=406 /DNA_ID=CAMNT_0000341597 /DNA_START=20 /DNA_END=1240 /DNA_ORIENTATION=+ /assembly_acc=CAM_ASM_000159
MYNRNNGTVVVVASTLLATLMMVTNPPTSTVTSMVSAFMVVPQTSSSKNSNLLPTESSISSPAYSFVANPLLLQGQKYQKTRRSLVTESSRATSIASTSTQLFGLLDFLSPYESKIPPELKDEIYKAEANTSAAQDRGKRIAFYTIVAIVGVALAVFNGFLTEIRMTGIDGNGLGVVPPEDGSTRVGVEVLVEAGFGWVLANPVFKFLFTNKIGGGLCILFGGASGLLAEAELDTKRLNAEKIYEELERRREQKMKKSQKQNNNQNKKKATGKKRRSGKETKRLSALSEVITVEEQPAATVPMDNSKKEDTVVEATTEKQEESEPTAMSDQAGGLFDKVKGFYEKADSMAASQALLLNKKLEDAGVVDKITDETGLKVIGKEEAEKLQSQQQQEQQQAQTEKEKSQ